MINTPRKNSKYYNISSSLEILLFLYFPGIQNKIIAKNMQIALFLPYLYPIFTNLLSKQPKSFRSYSLFIEQT